MNHAAKSTHPASPARNPFRRPPAEREPGAGEARTVPRRSDDRTLRHYVTLGDRPPTFTELPGCDYVYEYADGSRSAVDLDELLAALHDPARPDLQDLVADHTRPLERDDDICSAIDDYFFENS